MTETNFLKKKENLCSLSPALHYVIDIVLLTEICRCRDYERLGDCRRGLMCPFLHVVVPGQTPPIRTPDSTPLYERRMSFDPMGRPVQYVGAIPDGGRGLTVKTELCRDWSRFNGDCPRGTSYVTARISLNLNFIIHLFKSINILFLFCTRCQYLHGHPGDTCRDFQRRGRCWRGEVCPFSHNVAPMQGGSQRATCMRFLKGECNRGQSCHYYHPDGTEEPSSSSGEREVCRKYMRGECTRGDSCNYFHPHMQTHFKDESEYDHGDY